MLLVGCFTYEAHSSYSYSKPTELCLLLFCFIWGNETLRILEDPSKQQSPCFVSVLKDEGAQPLLLRMSQVPNQITDCPLQEQLHFWRSSYSGLKSTFVLFYFLWKKKIKKSKNCTWVLLDYELDLILFCKCFQKRFRRSHHKVFSLNTPVNDSVPQHLALLFLCRSMLGKQCVAANKFCQHI